MFSDLVHVTVNYWAIIVGALVMMVIGMIWYGPATMGKMWMKWNGLTDTGSGDNVSTLYFLQFVASLVMVYVLAHFVVYFDLKNFTDAWVLGFWVWLGFMVAGGAGIYIFPPKRWELFLFDSAYKLVSLVIVAWVLAVWR